MATIFIIIIYLAFISLGLPDAVLGSVWPEMSTILNVPLDYASILAFIVSLGTIISSLLSGWLLQKFKPYQIVIVSVLFTCFSLFMFSIVKTFWVLPFLAIPLGFGAGAIDSTLNHYVAANFKAYHMNFLHSCWGLGALIGPLIMSKFLKDSSYAKGYLIIASLQLILLVIFIFSIPLWKKNLAEKEKNTLINPFKIKGVIFALLIFLFYCSVEQTIILWGPTFLVKTKNLLPHEAAIFSSIFLLGLTIGRFSCGLLSIKIGDRKLILIGIIILFISIGCLFLPYNKTFTYIIFVMMGLGCAPVYPAMIHSTPVNFGVEESKSIIGFEMAFAYIGTTFIAPLFGKIATNYSLSIFPIYLFLFVILMIVMNILLIKNVKKA